MREDCILGPCISLQTNGYSRIYDPSIKKTVRGHRYEWSKVNGPIPKGTVIKHSCDNRGCVNLNHLELGTQSDNLKEMYERGRQGKRNFPKGEKHHSTKLTQEQVNEIRSMEYYKGFYSQMAVKYGVTRPTIRNIYTGYTWPNYAPPDLSDLVK